jgi:hypothetical protein
MRWKSLNAPDTFIGIVMNEANRFACIFNLAAPHPVTFTLFPFTKPFSRTHNIHNVYKNVSHFVHAASSYEIKAAASLRTMLHAPRHQLTCYDATNDVNVRMRQMYLDTALARSTPPGAVSSTDVNVCGCLCLFIDLINQTIAHRRDSKSTHKRQSRQRFPLVPARESSAAQRNLVLAKISLVILSKRRGGAAVTYLRVCIGIKVDCDVFSFTILDARVICRGLLEQNRTASVAVPRALQGSWVIHEVWQHSSAKPRLSQIRIGSRNSAKGADRRQFRAVAAGDLTRRAGVPSTPEGPSSFGLYLTGIIRPDTAVIQSKTKPTRRTSPPSIFPCRFLPPNAFVCLCDTSLPNSAIVGYRRRRRCAL